MNGAKALDEDSMGMYEVEHKAPADLDPVRSRLEAMNARYQRTIEQRDRYFQHPTRDFAETDEALRIRRIETVDGDGTPKTVLTYKGPRLDADSKTRREYETAIADEHTMEAILEGVGFTPVATVRKRRERWRTEEFLVCLDAVAELGSYVEIETTSESADVEAAASRARSLLADLGVDAANTTTASYLGMLLEVEE